VEGIVIAQTFGYITKYKKYIIGFLATSIISMSVAAIAIAAIPNSQTAEINACYRKTANLANPKGSLRVIDTQNNEACTNAENALSWDMGRIAYAHVKMDTFTGELIVDSGKNVQSVSVSETLNQIICIDLSSSVSNLTTITAQEGVNMSFAAAYLKGRAPGEANVTNYCPNGFDAAIHSGTPLGDPMEADFFFNIY